MITIKILRSDGSSYWVEHFNTSAEADAWLAQEKTRPYWDQVYTHSVTDNTPPPKSDEESALEKCYKNRRSAYPSCYDYLDAIVKNNDEQKQAYINACLAVKAKFPKPTED